MEGEVEAVSDAQLAELQQQQQQAGEGPLPAAHDAAASASASADGFRRQLPAEMISREDFSVWAFLKNCIGKELTKIAMPVGLNEPLSFLQRLSEYLQHSDLLFKAAAADDAALRMEYVAAFAVSAASSNWKRLNKPFNPLLGETFEQDRSKDLHYRMVSEQVSHHPPTSAFRAEATDGSWIFQGSISPKLSFWGKSIEVNPKGVVELLLPMSGEAYSWHNVQCKIHNIVVGKLWIENLGDMTISCEASSHKAELRWHSSSWTGANSHRVDGYILDASGARVRALYGSWVDAMYSLPVNEWKSYKRGSASKRRNASLLSNGSSRQDSSRSCSQSDSDAADGLDTALELAAEVESDLNLPHQRLLWKQQPRPAHSDKFYGFSDFTMSLNDDSDSTMMARLPPTDSRRRRDIRLLELGQHDQANSEKLRLEEKQRESKSLAGDADGGIWFRRSCDAAGSSSSKQQQQEWHFGGDYWLRDWAECPNIF